MIPLLNDAALHLLNGRCKDCSLGSHHVCTWLLPRTSLYSDDGFSTQTAFVSAAAGVFQGGLSASADTLTRHVTYKAWNITVTFSNLTAACSDPLSSPTSPCWRELFGCSHLSSPGQQWEGAVPRNWGDRTPETDNSAWRHWLLPSSQITRGSRTSLPMTSLRWQEIRRNRVL